MPSESHGVILPDNLEITRAAKEKLLIRLLARPDGETIAGLVYFVRFEIRDKDGTLLEARENDFEICGYDPSDIPPGFILEIGGRPLVVADGRWEAGDKLRLDFRDGRFNIEKIG